MSRPVTRILIGIIFLIMLAGAAVCYWQRNSGQKAAYRTAPVMRGDLTLAISATGTVEPEEVIDMGAQIAGQILFFGKDASGRTVDYGSMVSPLCWSN